MSYSIQVRLLCLLLLLTACNKVYAVCPASNLPTVENSAHNGTGVFEEGDVVKFKCLSGYKYVVRESDVIDITCSSNGLFIGSVPSCQSSDSQNVGSGYGCEDSDMCCPDTDNTCYTLGGCYCDTPCLTYDDCCSDYESYCLASGVSCTDLPTIPNASHNGGGDGDYPEGTVVEYNCDDGYVSDDPLKNFYTCLPSGNFFGGVFKCLRLCSVNDLPTVAHSSHYGGDASVVEGNVVTYICNANYVFQVAYQDTQTCSSSGTFTGVTPVCLHICPSSGLPTVVHSSHTGDGSYKAGEVVVYTCHSNYVLQVGSQNTQTCSSDGTFFGATPVCLGLCSVNDLPTVAHSSHNGGDGSVVEGNVVTYICHANYVFQVAYQDTQTCSSSGTFTGVTPVCLHICPSSGLPTVAHSSHNGDGTYMAGDVVTYTCNQDYVLEVASHNELMCLSSGSFQGVKLAHPVCLRVCTQSALPEVPFSVHDGDNTYMAGDIVTFTCSSGYIPVLGTPTTTTCLADGTFSATPACFKTINTECFPNGSIIVDNPDPEVFVSAHAADANDPCTTAWIADASTAKKWLQITGCNKVDFITKEVLKLPESIRFKDDKVTVSFSSRVDQTDEIYGGANVVSYVVKCEEIDVTGAVQTMTQGMAPKLSTASEAPVSVIIDVKSALRLWSAIGEIQTTASVGDELYWTIDIPVEYEVEMTSCIAYAGTSLAGTPVKQLVDSGCTADADLLENFSDMKVVTAFSHIKRYYTRLWAFKFQGNDHVFFNCEVKLCPGGSPHCDINCSTRKKRFADVAPVGVKYGATSRVLKVNPASEYISSSTKSRLQQDLAIAGVVTIVCWIVKAVFL